MQMRLNLQRRSSFVDAALRAAVAGAEVVTQIQIELCEIAAPIEGEDARAEAVARWLRSSGCDVSRDAAGNVIGRRPGRQGAGGLPGSAVALSAHLDSVFPAGQPVRVARAGEPNPYRPGPEGEDAATVPAGELHAPGIGDDAAGLATMIGVARALSFADGGFAGSETESDILFIATVGEEGRGDLRGARHLFAQPQGQELHAFITLDHPEPGDIIHRGVASRRFLVEFRGPGGHSWGHAGRYNPALTMADAALRIAAIPTPDHPRTTCNVGVMSAGRSVNAIPELASMQIDLRSESMHALDALDDAVQAAIRASRADALAMRPGGARLGANGSGPEARCTVRVIGDRPGGQTPADSALVKAAHRALSAEGFKPRLTASSTDANAGMAAGVPSICLGWGGRSGEQHSLREWFAPAGRERTLSAVTRLIVDLAGAPERRADHPAAAD